MSVASGKGRVLRWLSGVVLNEVEVTGRELLSPAFLLLRVRGAVARGEPGDKIQVLLPTDDVRTYTPFAWRDGGFSLLVHLRGASPASVWARALSVGDRVRFLGPQRSLRMPEGPLVLIGDETSLAVAASYAEVRPGVRVVLEGAIPADVLARIGLSAEVCAPGGAAALARAHPGAIGITGGGALLSRVRSELGGRAPARVKAYWVEGRAGID